jgi:hypothetical protein
LTKKEDVMLREEWLPHLQDIYHIHKVKDTAVITILLTRGAAAAVRP